LLRSSLCPSVPPNRFANCSTPFIAWIRHGAAGVRKFACGIAPAANAKTIRSQPDGKVLVTDGPYTETKEHMGGFWILECADMNEALAWAKKGAIVCDVAGEVRELLFFPAPE
jgi:hypothetical protein